MRRFLYCFLILFILSACTQNQNIEAEEDEILSTENVEVPSTIFISEKQNSVIDEEEIKLSIKTYLDSYEDLTIASYPFFDILDEEKELTKIELEKFEAISKLTIENDENFSNYITKNTLPEAYQEESERISQYITMSNEILYEMINMADDLYQGIFPKVDIQSIKGKTNVVNGREQKKIEDFLDKEAIETKAFGRVQ